MVCVHKSLSNMVTFFRQDILNECIVLTIDNKATLGSKCIALCFPYISHEYSPVYERTSQTGIEMLDTLISHLKYTLGDVCILVGGDLNARTGILHDYMIDSNIDEFLDMSCMNDLFEGIDTHRCSRDTDSLNNYGKQLVQLCKVRNMYILNGRTKGDTVGHITCIANHGRSVVDYFVADYSLHPVIESMCVTPRPESDHFPLSVSICIKNWNEDKIRGAEENCELFPFHKLRWVDSHRDKYVDTLEILLLENSNNFRSEIESNTDKALEMLVATITSSAACMQPKQRKRDNTKRGNAPWWDLECECAKRTKYELLDRFHHTNSKEDLEDYLRSKRLLKNICERKKESHRETNMKNLLNACSSPNSKAFWQQIKGLLAASGDRFRHSTISGAQWVRHFEKLLNPEDNLSSNNCDVQVWESLPATIETNDLKWYNDPISYTEIESALHALKLGKACGSDGIGPEFLKYHRNGLTSYLYYLFNYLFDSSTYPSQWTESVVFPLHKKGSLSSVDNYRGLSLQNTLSKVFCRILHRRLSIWVEDNNLIPESQAGFRKDYSTVDHIFCLQALVQKYITKAKGRFYVLFVDFAKAFDSIDRSKLWYILAEHGLTGKLFRCLQSIYQNSKACVRVGMNDTTDYFSYHVGVKQGCILSPLLFSLFISKLDEELNCSNLRGTEILTNDLSIFTLMYADDCAIMDDSVIGLQRKIKVLDLFCEKWGLKVNTNKTKVVVFRNGGKLRQNEKWHFNGHKLHTSTYYSYLGLIFSSRLSWSKAMDNQSVRARRIVSQLRRVCRQNHFMNPSVMFKIFDTKIKPVLLYASEIWGVKRWKYIEQVQVMFCKAVLNVGKTSWNCMILGDCGRHSMFVDYHFRAIKYWCKILSLDDFRYAKKSYLQLVMHDESGRHNWASELRKLLCSLGYGYVYANQNVGDVKLFLIDVKIRLIAMSESEWKDKCEECCEEYLNYHPSVIVAPYVNMITSYKKRRIISLLRSKGLPLNKNLKRMYPGHTDECKFCKRNTIEDEYHVLFGCKQYAVLRNYYLLAHTQHVANVSEMDKLYSLYKSCDTSILSDVSTYLLLILDDRLKSEGNSPNTYCT